MRHLSKAASWVLGAWLALYVILCVTYLTLNITHMKIVNDIEFRSTVAIFSVIVLGVIYFVNAETSKAYHIIQRGGSAVTTETMEDIQKSIMPDDTVWVEKSKDGTRYLIHIS